MNELGAAAKLGQFEWLAERQGVEERGYSYTTGFVPVECLLICGYFWYDLCSLPLGQQKQEEISSVSQGGNADTGFLHIEIHRVRGGRWRKLWFALEEERYVESLHQMPSYTS